VAHEEALVRPFLLLCLFFFVFFFGVFLLFTLDPLASAVYALGVTVLFVFVMSFFLGSRDEDLKGLEHEHRREE
jgi:O-antigen/teichoic acid export membrane protein